MEINLMKYAPITRIDRYSGGANWDRVMIKSRGVGWIGKLGDIQGKTDRIHGPIDLQYGLFDSDRAISHENWANQV